VIVDQCERHVRSAPAIVAYLTKVLELYREVSPTFDAYVSVDDVIIPGDIDLLGRLLPDVPNAPVREVYIMITDGIGYAALNVERTTRHELQEYFNWAALDRLERELREAQYGNAPLQADVDFVRRCHADRTYMNGDDVPDSVDDGGDDNVSFFVNPMDEMATCYRRSELLRFWTQNSNQEYVGIYDERRRSDIPEMMVFKMPYEGVWVINAYRVLSANASRRFLLKPVGVSGIGTARFGVGTLHGEENRIYVMVPDAVETVDDIIRMDNVALPNWDVQWQYDDRENIFERR
jgi:hypothetical protein